MATTIAMPQNKAAKSVVAFIVQKMRQGMSNAAIAQGLVAMGVDASESSRVVDTVTTEVIRVARQQRPTVTAVITGLAGGMLVALVCGAAWGLIVARIDFEIGYMAWGLGLFVGLAVVLFARGKKGLPLQTTAVIASAAGIGFAKYVLFAQVLQRIVLQRAGAVAAARLPMFSAKVLAIFIHGLPKLLTPYDGLWIVLAVITAWRIPKGMGVRIPPQVISE